MVVNAHTWAAVRAEICVVVNDAILAVLSCLKSEVSNAAIWDVLNALTIVVVRAAA